MPTFEDFENNRAEAQAETEDSGFHDKGGHKHSRGATALAPSAPHRGEIIEYSPNRKGPPPLNRAALLRKEQRLRRSKKYTQKIDLGATYKLSDSSFFQSAGDLIKGFLQSLKKLLRNFVPSRKKSKREDVPSRRRRRPRRRGGKNQYETGGREKDRRSQDRQNRSRGGGSRRSGPQKQGFKKSGNDHRGNSRMEAPRDNKANPNRNRRRRRKPSSNQGPGNPSRKD